MIIMLSSVINYPNLIQVALVRHCMYLKNSSPYLELISEIQKLIETYYLRHRKDFK